MLTKTFKYTNELSETIIFNYDNGYLINKPIGIDTINVDYNRSQGINQVGQSIQGQKIQSRPININGVLIDNYYKDLLLSVIRPDLKGKLYADNYYLDVVPTMTPNISPDDKLARFNFQLLAPYPYWQSENEQRKSFSQLVYRFKLPFNMTKPYRFAEQIKKEFINLRNDGQVPVPFRVNIYARDICKNPSLVNAITKEFLKINKSMQVGERIVIDITHERTNVTSSVDGDIRGTLTLDSTFDRLDVGDNVIKPNADSGKENIDITIEYATEKVGVTV